MRNPVIWARGGKAQRATSRGMAVYTNLRAQLHVLAVLHQA